jgi:MATE family multidrug resistance protein
MLNLIKEHYYLFDILMDDKKSETKFRNKDLLDTEQSSNDLDLKARILNKNVKIPFEQIGALKDVIVNAVPATMGLMFIFIAETINIIFVGRLNDATVISAIGIGTLYVNAMGYVIGLGLIGAIDTLCSQSYGAKQYKLTGIYVNVGRIVSLAFFFVIVLPCIFFSDTVMLAIGQSQEVADLASSFSYSMIPSLFFALQYNCSVRYLQAMQIFLPGMIITLITAILHSVWCYFFIFWLEYGIMGAGFAIGVTQLLNFIFVTIYTHLENPCPESYCYFPAESWELHMLIEYLKLGVPSTVLFAADWLGFEVLTFMSSFLGNINLAANVVLFNFISLIFMIPLGISFAITSLVGNSIGGAQVINAKKYSIIGILTGISIVGFFTILIIIFRHEIPYIYTSEENVVEIVRSLLGIYVFFSVIDSIQIVENGILKGLGKQKISSIVCLIILYPINIPMLYLFGFTWGYGIIGLWYTQLITVILLCVSYFIIIMLCDWDQISKDCIEKFEVDRKVLEIKKLN